MTLAEYAAQHTGGVHAEHFKAILSLHDPKVAKAARKKAYRQLNREKINAYQRERRRRLKAAAGDANSDSGKEKLNTINIAQIVSHFKIGGFP